ncbi:phosphodiesterase [Cellulomonas fimi]|uniref:Phosphodiesterase n=1 Tax=Cellulomonas fimi TaxID=1708 RepID=A0A7Y0LWJ4_CELFI|nr:phosphodiesterase [Cellulomonas fimi]
MWWRPALREAAESLGAAVTSAIALGLAFVVLDAAGARSWLDVLLAAVLIAVGHRLARPVLRVVASVLGIVGAMVAGLAAQVVVAWAALTLVAGIVVRSWLEVLVLLVVASVVLASGRWLVGANDSSYVVGDVLRVAPAGARRGETSGARPRGLLVVQLDGVSREVLVHAVQAGLAPTITRWLRSGSHRLAGWWASVPATTPASQAGLLHGSTAAVPAFRWWDKELGRVVVTNHPVDAALVEARLSDGHGLLAHGGAAVSTMFTGDAPTALLVMSRARGRRGPGPGTAFIRFFASPYVLTRTIGLTLGEMVKELYQGHRQRVRRVEPRVPRRGAYVALRALSNVLLRDLNTAVVAEQLLDGAPTVFVDLVDYDEIAHHAGPLRPEALRALEGLDRVLHVLVQVAARAPRDYAVVVLSDHGQSLGATFEQVEGASLLEVVRDLMTPETGGGRAAAVRSDAREEWSPLNALLGASGGARVTDRSAPAASGRGGARRDAAVDASAGADAEAEPRPEVAVTASGNLAMLWFPRLPGRVPLEEIARRWPLLVDGLLARAAIGVVVAATAHRGPVAIGARGTRLLADGVDLASAVHGQDPLAPYGPRARPDLLRLAGLADAGDLVVVSSVDRYGQVHAFEELVGSHGGLGGAQNDALLLHPADWTVEADLCTDVDGTSRLVGAESVHQQLVRWQRALGVRP